MLVSGKSEFCIIYATFPDFDSAKNASISLLENNLAACCNVSKEVQSLYKWGGNICEDEEFKLLIKTKNSFYQKVEDHILEQHPYENPCIFSINIEKGSENFLKWIDKSVL